MNFVQNLLQVVEVGKGQILIRIVPLLAGILILGIAYDFTVFHGLSDPQSMDNAQLARQIARGEGFTTKFIRPRAITQMQTHRLEQSVLSGGSGDLFPADQFPPGKPRVLPDTYNAPGYPYLLATWFLLVHPEFFQPFSDLSATHVFSGDRWIAPLNQIFFLLTGLLVFMLGRRLFDDRVAWMALISFFGTELLWHYTISAMSTTVLMFLITGMLFCALEIFSVGEACFESEVESFAPAWLWALALGLILGAATLMRLHLIVLLLPLVVVLFVMPRANLLLFVVIALLSLGALGPWLWHTYAVSGNPLGSNTPQLLYGEEEYKGNEIFCTTSIPSYERLFRDASKKEFNGFRFHFEHIWNLLGSSPMILLFGAATLHRFKRRPTQLFHWLVIGSAIFLIAANNLGTATPDTLGPWNVVIVLFPAMLVIGTAFFFILVDRLNLSLWLLNNLIVGAMLVLTFIPVALTVTTFNNLFYAFPPYMPPAIKSFGEFVQPDEWITTDMPWATAWYADRSSLWLPDSITDFQHLHDNVCPTGLILLTPVTWSAPLSNATTGEYKDWLPLVIGLTPPSGFPLSSHTVTAPGGPEYSLWSDRERWKGK